MDLSQLNVLPKIVRPIEAQDPRESRRLWQTVTRAILDKKWGDATKNKQNIEQVQRNKATERQKRGEEWVTFSLSLYISLSALLSVVVVVFQFWGKT